MSRVKVNEITNKVATGPVDFPDGITGVALTVTGNVTVGGTIISEDTTNVDSVGWVTARSGLTVGPPATGIGATVHSNGNAVFAGITTVGGDFSIADKIIHTGDTDTAIRFSGADTITAETGGSERVRITSTGLVGINETTPEEILDLGESNKQNLKVGQRGYLGQAHSTSATILGHSVKADTTNSVADQMMVTETNSGGGAPSAIRQTTGNIQFHTASSGTADAVFSSERLRIGSAGQIGIAGANYGTSGQVLTSGGSGSTVSWADAAGGAWELVTSGLVDSGGEYEIIGTTSTLTSSYQMYRLTFFTEQSPNIGESGLQLQIYNGSWREDTNYGYGQITNGGSVNSQTSAKGILLGRMGGRFEGVIQFSNPSQTTRPKWFSARLASMNSDTGWSEPLNYQTNGQYNGSTKNDAVTGIRLRSIDSSSAGSTGGGQNFSGGYYLLEGCAIS